MPPRPNIAPVRYRPSKSSGSGHRATAGDPDVRARSSCSAEEFRGAVTAAPIEVGTPTLCPVSQPSKHLATDSEPLEVLLRPAVGQTHIPAAMWEGHE